VKSESVGEVSLGARSYVLGALTAAYTLAFVDRVIVGILNEPLKAEFGLSDLQLGLLGGISFAIFYTILGIPIARLAERFNRVKLLSGSVALWSVMTVLCGLAPSYAALLAARVGVGVGEAGCTPAAHSLIADYFPPRKRASALSIYGLGIPIGSMLAALIGGWATTALSWREAFLLAGLPGMALAALIVLTVREPPRQDAPALTPPFTETLRALLRQPAYVHVLAGGALASVFGYGVLGFLTSFYRRAYGLDQMDAALANGALMGVGATIGAILGGILADRAKRPGFTAYAPALAFVVAIPFFLLAFLAPSAALSLGAMMIATAAHYVYLGPMAAMAQESASPRARATSAAILLFVVNIVGLCVGPPLVGAASDAFTQAYGEADGLKYALCLALPFELWAAAHFLLAGRARDRIRT
jgi:predicted MFS family arabinose efflux permease